MNEFDREDFEYILRLTVDGMTDYGYTWLNDSMRMDPERILWLLALAAEMVELAAIDKHTATQVHFPEVTALLSKVQ